MQKYEIFDVILGLSPYLWTRVDLKLKKNYDGGTISYGS